MKQLISLSLLLLSIAGARGDSIRAATISAGAATLNNGSVVNIGQLFVGIMSATDGTVFNAGVIPLLPSPPSPPELKWPKPADIAYGTPLSETQLNATADVPGGFDYLPVAKTMLKAGNDQPLTVKFTPTDSVKYLIATKTVLLNVRHVPPVVSNATFLDGRFRLTLSTEPGVPYILQWTTNLQDWLPASSGVGEGGTLTLEDSPDLAKFPYLFYRILVE